MKKLVCLFLLTFFQTVSAGIIQYAPNTRLDIVKSAERIGQSFIAEDPFVEAGLNFDVLNPSFSAADPIKYELFEGFTVNTGNMVSSVSFSLSTSFTGFALQDFSSTPLSIGTTYTLVASIVGSSPLWGIYGTDVAPANTGVCFNGTPCIDNVQYALLVNPVTVPVPAAVWLFGTGLFGLICSRRKPKLLNS